MKKTALVTCYFQPNYGSMLQAYATQQKLEELGIPNETINIEGFKDEIHSAKIKYFKSRMFSIDVIKDKLGYLKLSVIKKINSELNSSISKRNQKFKEFSEKYFNLSCKYKSIKELGEKSCEYSAFLVGSDQLWLPSNIAADYYTLNFVSENVRRIAYATSFGVSELPAKQEKMAQEFLPKIDFLSVREQSGKKLIKDITGLDAKLVCDPTLLLSKSEWMKIVSTERFIKEKYIFCYFLGNNKFSRECALKLKEKTGYKIVALQQLDMYIRSDEKFADYAPYNAGPAEFVNLIANAEYICTDSFHGTVFSIINNKTFFSFRRFVKKTSMSTNSRIDSLLNVLGITDRIIEDKKTFENRIKDTINYADVNVRLNDFRNESVDFLKGALSGLE